MVDMKRAVSIRIMELCDEKNMSLRELARITGVPPTTVYSIINEKSQNPGLITLRQLCYGFNVNIQEFFDRPYFKDAE